MDIWDLIAIILVFVVICVIVIVTSSMKYKFYKNSIDTMNKIKEDIDKNKHN